MARHDPEFSADPNLTTSNWDGRESQKNSASHSPAIRYEKQAALGLGPSPSVWRAYDHDLRRVVAIKVLPKERLSDSSGFLAGARTIASIRHTGIVQIHDIVEERDGLWIISDYVEGESLAERLHRDPCPAKEIFEWWAQIAETLAFIHSRGIIHADVSPSNILISENGQAHLCNFCSARTVGDQPATPTTPEKSPYMAPEFAHNLPLEPHCDVFSLGVLLTEALNGRKRQKNLGPAESTSAQPNQSRKIPTAIHALLAKCVSPIPVERPSAQELANTLRKILAADRQRRPWMGVMIGVGILVCALGSWFMLAPDHWRGIDSETIALSRVEELSRQLRIRNPDFDGSIVPIIENGLIKGLEFMTNNISDLTPLASLRELNDLRASAIDGGGKVCDLSPIKGLGIKRLQLNGNPQLENLDPLKGMPLEYLSIEGTRVSDLSALSGAPLKTLNCSRTRVKSLRPLANAPLATLWMNETKIDNLDGMPGMRLTHLRAEKTDLKDLAPLSGMPLQTVNCNHTHIESIEPLRGMNDLSVVSVANTKVTNLNPLLSLSGLKFLYCDIDWKRDEDVIRRLGQLEIINDSKHADLIRWYEGGQKEPEPKKKNQRISRE